jgi:phosphoglycolate phosphatase-like HAD superfamily hydrolase
MIKLIIFDFDGTLADSLEIIFHIINNLASEFDYHPSSYSEINQLKKLTDCQIIKQSGIALYKIPFLVRRLRIELKQELLNIALFPGIQEAIRELHQQGYQLGIITYNSRENVRRVLENHGLHDAFDFIYNTPTIIGKHQVIRKLLKEKNLSPAHVVVVGDEIRDIVGAKKAKTRAIAVSWGFDDRELLVTNQPDVIIDHPQEILPLVYSW